MRSVMTMDDVLELEAGDYSGFYKTMSVRDALPLVTIDDSYHRKLKARMQERQSCDVPVWVTGRSLLNGHHRVKIAHELGFSQIDVTDERQDSCVTEDDRWHEYIL